MFNEFQFVGKGTVVIDGKEMPVECRFTGKQKDIGTEDNSIAFDLVEKDGVLVDYILL